MNINDIKGKIIAVDLDGTLSPDICWNEEDVEKSAIDLELVEKINQLSQNNLIMIYTGRRDVLIPPTLRWLRKHGVQFHAFSNLKPPFDYYIDQNYIDQKSLRKEDLII